MTDEKTNEDQDFLDDALGTENIFSSDEAIEGMRAQAEALGIDPESVDLSKTQKVLYARKGCKHCFGRGGIAIVPSPANAKKTKLRLEMMLERKVRRSRRTKTPMGKWKKKVSQKRIRVHTEMPGNGLGKVWNTQLPEPIGVKRELLEYRPCRCVRTLDM